MQKLEYMLRVQLLRPCSPGYILCNCLRMQYIFNILCFLILFLLYCSILCTPIRLGCRCCWHRRQYIRTRTKLYSLVYLGLGNSWSYIANRYCYWRDPLTDNSLNICLLMQLSYIRQHMFCNIQMQNQSLLNQQSDNW